MWKVKSQCLSIHNIEIEAPLGVFDFEKLIIAACKSKYAKRKKYNK